MLMQVTDINLSDYLIKANIVFNDTVSYKCTLLDLLVKKDGNKLTLSIGVRLVFCHGAPTFVMVKRSNCWFHTTIHH